MKRSLIITIGVVIILLVLGLWVYLLLFGAPEEPKDVFTNLGITKNTEDTVRVIDAQTAAKNETKLALGGSQLQQLTTRSVAGFGFASSSGTTDTIRYVEKGTGHIYEINLNSGTETQISLLTLPRTVEALFSPEASAVVFINDTGVSVGFIPEKNAQMKLIELPADAKNVSFKDEVTLYYTQNENGKTVGRQLNLLKLTKTEVFSTQLHDIDVFWGNGFTTTYIQTKPTQYLEGQLYSISKNVLTPVVPSAYGLTSFINGKNILTSFISGVEYTTTWPSSALNLKQGIVMLKEKCVFSTQEANFTWCAAPLALPKNNYVENWYKGVETSEDYLWSNDLATQSSELIADFTELSGKTIDVLHMATNQSGTLLLFGNKIDQTLWLYNLEQQ